ncbi:type II secretion system protein [Candidatus Poribacteria bacterium]|nr:type II secretion system protein [Candidatus Poribacteria bacterium]
MYLIQNPKSKIQNQKGFTLVELLVALAIASILMLGLIAAFQTTQRTAAVGEAREQIYQNARVALDLMAREIKGAYIDNRNRDLVFVSADGLGGRGNSILQYDPANPTNSASWVLGLGNAQTPHGIDPTGPLVFYLYADRTFGSPIFTDRTVKALGANGFPAPDLRPGPPDRLDFACLTANYPGNTGNESRLAEVRYIVTTETFVDDVDNDRADGADSADNDPPGSGAMGLGDMIAMNPQYRTEDFNETTGKIKGLSLFQIRRALDISPDKNPFSVSDIPICSSPPCPPGAFTPVDPNGRYPDRNLADFETTNNGENIGSYIYDLQLEFYGRIAIALDAGGAPEVWGVGWDYQDVRGEDVGTDCGGTLGAGDQGAQAVNVGTVQVTRGSTSVTGTGTAWVAGLAGGVFFIWPTSATEFDVTDPDNKVYTIASVAGATSLTLDRPYEEADATGLAYRIIEPTQANGILDGVGTANSEDRGADGLGDGLPGAPLDDELDDGSGIPNNVSDNDGVTDEPSVGQGNGRLDSRVMGIWDSRSPDPRNPRRAAELDGVDNDSDSGMVAGGGLGNDTVDNDSDGVVDDRTAAFVDGANNVAYASPEANDPATTGTDETNDLVDDDDLNGTPGDDGIADDRFYEPAGKPEGIDEPDEASPNDDTLPKAVRITIAVSDSQQSLEPVVLSTTVWLSTAK